MTQYIKADGAVSPYTDRDMKRDNSNVSFPKNITDENRASVGVYPVTVAQKPAHDASTQVVEQSTPQEVNGAWIAGWTVRDKTQDELAAYNERLFSQINTERERRLAEGSSFTVEGVVNPIPLQGRPFDQTVYLALLTRASGLKSAGVITPALTLRDGTDTTHELTPDQMISLISQSMTWFESVMAASWAMKDGTAPFEAGIPDNFTDDVHWPV